MAAWDKSRGEPVRPRDMVSHVLLSQLVLKIDILHQFSLFLSLSPSFCLPLVCFVLIPLLYFSPHFSAPESFCRSSSLHFFISHGQTFFLSFPLPLSLSFFLSSRLPSPFLFHLLNLSLQAPNYIYFSSIKMGGSIQTKIVGSIFYFLVSRLISFLIKWVS